MTSCAENSKQRAMRILIQKPYYTRCICEACKKEFVSRIQKVETAEWEVRTKFERHSCEQQFYKDRV
jgi:hypothetical protein